MSIPRLSAFECLGRGVANLRGNWELALAVFAQVVVCSALLAAGLVAIAVAVGATVWLDDVDPSDPERLLRQLEALSLDAAAIAIGLSALFVLTTVVTLVYCWFQAGIVSTLAAGERQAPLASGREAELFRTFSRRNFLGWSRRSALRFFWLLGWMLLLSTVLVAVVGVVVVLVTLVLQQWSGAAAATFGCLMLVPVVPAVLAINFWMAVGQALATRDEQTPLRAASVATSIVGRRFGGVLLIALLFVVAGMGLGIVFFVLNQGMAIALRDSGLAGVLVQLLLTAAQWLISGVLSVAYLGTAVAMARTEIDRLDAERVR